MPRTIVLAYSGGLDTSIIVPWLQRELRGARVICVAADIGQGGTSCAACATRRSPRAPTSATSRTCARSSSRLHLPDAARRRDLQSQVPARHLDGAPAHREAPGRGRAPRRRRRARARLHRQGQRPGALRADLRRVRARSAGHRAVARVGHPQPRGRDRLRRVARHPDRGDAGRRSTRATPTSGISRTRAGSSRIRTPAPPDGPVHADRPSPKAPDTPEDVVDRLRARHARVGERRDARPGRRSSPRSTRSAAGTASAASISSRIAWSA